jgi:hypothetical protein
LPESLLFVCGQIARALARAPGRFEVDEEEAYRILDDIIAWWESGKFGPDEVVVVVDGDGDPPQLQRRPLSLVLDEAQQRGEPLQLWPRLHWRDYIMLTYPAAKRYVETCGSTGAPRLLSELFSDATAARHRSEPSASPATQITGEPSPSPAAALELFVAEFVKAEGRPTTTGAAGLPCRSRPDRRPQ